MGSFLEALLLAVLSAFAYAELVTKYPGAAGAALYANRAFRNPFVSFMVAFVVVCSGLASAGAAARAFGGDYLSAFVILTTLLVAVLFVAVLSTINFIGISKPLKTNLLLILGIGVLALSDGSADVGRPFHLLCRYGPSATAWTTATSASHRLSRCSR